LTTFSTDLAQVLAGLAEVALQLADPIVQALDVADHGAHLGLDDAGLLAHAHVLQDRAHRIERGHQRGRRDDPDPGPVGLLHHCGEVGVKLGIDRFAGQEHQRRFRGLAGHDVSARDVLDVLAQVGGEGAASLHLLNLVGGFPQGSVAFQGKLGVDPDRARRVRQLKQAVNPAALADGHLKAIAVGRQGRAHQILQLDLAEGTAGLLVGQDVLQADHLGGKLGDVLLGLVDDRQALAQIGKRGLALLGGDLKPVADPLGEVRQALLQGLGDGALLGLELFGQPRLDRGLAVGHL
jgi:hypothetical protein